MSLCVATLKDFCLSNQVRRGGLLVCLQSKHSLVQRSRTGKPHSNMLASLANTKMHISLPHKSLYGHIVFASFLEQHAAVI